MADQISRAPENPPTPPAVAPLGNGNASSVAPPSPGAQVAAPLFGGLRGGRPRKDGLAPGSPEAIEADRKKDAERKRRQREQQPKPEPPPLPSATAVPAAGSLGALRPAIEGSPAAPWDPKMLQPLFDQLVPTVEKVSVGQITRRARVARIPEEIVKVIETDAAWSPVAKTAIESSGPQVAAKWLTRFGISSENQHELVLGTAIVSILSSHVLIIRRLDKLAASANAPLPAKPGQSQPAPAPASAPAKT